MTPEQRVEWEAGVRSLYHDGMVRIVVTPTWAKLIDFETTLPSPVEVSAASATGGCAGVGPGGASLGQPTGCRAAVLARPAPRRTTGDPVDRHHHRARRRRRAAPEEPAIAAVDRGPGPATRRRGPPRRPA